jgi:proline iminopeptidase
MRAAGAVPGGGLVVFLAATAAGAGVATRKLPSRGGRTRLAPFAGGALAGVVVFVATALLPVGDPRLPPAPVAGQGFWELPTGSRIAYVHLPARGRPRPAPVVFLHGGPGVANMAGDAAFFGQLTGDGFDVYVYDQVGTGRSARLADPHDYTIARGVADLEAIRGRIGADRLVLIGHSWGGQVAAGSLAAYPTRVARVVFSLPGSPGPGSGRRQRRRRADTAHRRPAARPGPAAAASPGAAGVDAAAGQPRGRPHLRGRRRDGRSNDRVYNHGRAGAHCRGAPPGPALHGLGFYAYQFPQSAAARPWADPRPQLARLSTPALVIKGSCDYLSWATGVAYRQALPAAQLVYLRRAGHNAYQDQPAAFLEVVRAFLTGRPLPIAPWTGGVPADFEGPPGEDSTPVPTFG